MKPAQPWRADMGANVEPTGRLRVVQLEKEQSNSWNRKWAHGGGSERRKWKGGAQERGREREREGSFRGRICRTATCPVHHLSEGLTPAVSASQRKQRPPVMETKRSFTVSFTCRLPTAARPQPKGGLEIW